jgi:hypothetical protein
MSSALNFCCNGLGRGLTASEDRRGPDNGTSRSRLALALTGGLSSFDDWNAPACGGLVADNAPWLSGDGLRLGRGIFGDAGRDPGVDNELDLESELVRNGGVTSPDAGVVGDSMYTGIAALSLV